MEKILQSFEKRRKHLGMSQAKLAELSGVSLPTVQRFFNDPKAQTSFETVCKIADMLGVSLAVREEKDEAVILREKAREKARWLASIVLGTSALEKQQVDELSSAAIERKFYQELMNGPKSKIWSS